MASSSVRQYILSKTMTLSDCEALGRLKCGRKPIQDLLHLHNEIQRFERYGIIIKCGEDVELTQDGEQLASRIRS